MNTADKNDELLGEKNIPEFLQEIISSSRHFQTGAVKNNKQEGCEKL